MRYDNINQNEEKDDGKKYGNLVNMLMVSKLLKQVYNFIHY